MTVNDGNGLFDKYGIIDSIIVALDRLVVQGVGNMQIVISSINRLSALKDGLKREEEMANANDHNEQEQDV